MYKVGDIVTVTDSGKIYSTYPNWFKIHNIDIDYACRYAYNNYITINPFECNYKIVAKGGHHTNDNAMLYLITEENDYGNSPMFLIGEKGIAKRKKMTLSEIEKELGYPIELIGLL